MTSTSIDQLCEGLPFEMIHFLSYCRQLKTDEEPNYDYLVMTLQNCIQWIESDFDELVSERF